MKRYYLKGRNRSRTLLSDYRHKLKNTEDNFNKIFNLAPVLLAISRLDDGSFVSVNNKFLSTLEYSYEEIIGKTSGELMIFVDSSQREKALTAILDQGAVGNFEAEVRTKTGKILTVIFYGEIIEISRVKHLLTVAVDISKQREIEKRMSFFDRLNLVGQMAATIAHEIRNPLATVKGFLQLEQMRNKSIGTKSFQIMMEELNRVNTIIDEYLSLTRTTEKLNTKEDLNKIIEAIYPLLQSDALDQNKSVTIALEEKLPEIFLNAREIRQLIFNLVRNGLEAMEENGEVTIRTYTTSGQAVLVVSDGGRGIEPRVLEKLGAPFITTKTNGTGLGLSVVYRIAEKHKAMVEVQTSSQGTNFYIKFPLMM